jgi:hypothetical protein
MADMLDEAEATTEMFFQQALRNRGRGLELTGQCHVCEEPTEGAFCSVECREDFEKMERLNKINGKK